MCVCVHSNVYLCVLIRRAARTSTTTTTYQTTDLHEALFDIATMLHVHYKNVIYPLLVSPILLPVHTMRRYLDSEWNVCLVVSFQTSKQQI